MRTVRPAFVLLALAAMIGGFALGGLLLPRDTELETATLLEPARPLPAFELVRENGRPITQADLRGDWSLLFFGFTHCPDICPSTLETLAAVKRRLESDNGPVPRVLFATVDPTRDDAETLAAYTRYFDPDFQGITGPEQSMQSLARSLGILSVKVPAGDGEAYTVDHGAAILLVDPDARLRAVFGAPHRIEAMAHDLAVIMEGRAVSGAPDGRG